ncbi:MAG: spore coat protein, partial [Clostridia bacterium]
PQASGASSSAPAFSATYGTAENQDKKNDCFLCSDVLTAEKHASHLYDTCIFEFKDKNIRDILNHIQKEEQGHGKMIYDYMQANGMYA